MGTNYRTVEVQFSCRGCGVRQTRRLRLPLGVEVGDPMFTCANCIRNGKASKELAYDHKQPEKFPGFTPHDGSWGYKIPPTRQELDTPKTDLERQADRILTKGDKRKAGQKRHTRARPLSKDPRWERFQAGLRSSRREESRKVIQEILAIPSLLGTLSDLQRAIIQGYCEGLSYRKLERRLGIPKTEIGRMWKDAKRKIRDSLQRLPSSELSRESAEILENVREAPERPTKPNRETFKALYYMDPHDKGSLSQDS
jgi:hypothetical protein